MPDMPSWINDATNFDSWGSNPSSTSGFPWGSLIGGAAGWFGSQGNDSTTDTRTVPPELQGLLSGIGNAGLDILNQPYEQAPPGVAGPTDDQYAGWDSIRNWATGNQLPQQSSDALSRMMSSGGAMAPQSSNPYMGASASVGSNPWENRTTSVGTNPYAGSNPYLEQNIQNTMGDMARTYNQQVAPTMAANAYQSGSFGNTGQQEMENESRNQLQQNLGRTSANMRMQDYGMQQGLAESDIARRMGAQQTDLARSAGIAEGGLNRSLQGSLADLSRNANIYSTDAALNSSNWNSAAGRQLSAINSAPNIYGSGFSGGAALSGIGNDQRGIANQYATNNVANFNDARGWPARNFGIASSIFGATPTGGTSTTTAPSGNPWAGLIGGAGIGNSIWQP